LPYQIMHLAVELLMVDWVWPSYHCRRQYFDSS